ncbi:AsnC family protein [Salmonella enterica]|nr:AsnC family protein [Salmonella enterica]
MIPLKPMGTPGKCPAHIRRWTAKEDELLISLYPSMTSKEMTTYLDRTEQAIRARAHLFIQRGILSAKYERFTPDQDAFIRANCRNMTLSEMGAYLGKSKDCVNQRASRLRVSCGKTGDYHRSTKYPDSDVVLIRALRNEGLTFPCIAEKFEMRISAVKWVYHHRLTAVDAIARGYLPR